MPTVSLALPAIWFVGGPPVGSGVFEEVQKRLGRGEAIPLLDDAAPTDGWRARADALAARARAVAGPVVLVAHGLAVPAALAAAPAFAGVFLLNGPVSRLDPVTGALAGLAARAPGLVAGSLLHPDLLPRWLASSAGLRRVVTNPYVMDRDTVAALAVSTVGTPGLRRAAASYLGSLAAGLPEVGPVGVPLGVLWGDEDRLYPASEADFLSTRAGLGPYTRIPGGRFLAVVERPWEVADRVGEFLSICFRSTETTTPVSRSAAEGSPRARRGSKKASE